MLNKSMCKYIFALQYDIRCVPRYQEEKSADREGYVVTQLGQEINET